MSSTSVYNHTWGQTYRTPTMQSSNFVNNLHDYSQIWFLHSVWPMYYTMYICMNKQEIACDSKNTGIVPNKKGPVLLSQVKLLRRPAIWSDTSFKETGLVMLLCSAFLSWESCKFKHWSACSVIYEDLSGNVL